MKILLTLFLLASTYCQAQSSFFVGANGSMNITTLLNKEDKSAPNGMLNKKNGIQPGYGIQIGYIINNRFAISIEPNRLQYKVNYSGASDTANVRSFEASARFTYYQIPLVLTYKQPITERLSINAGVGMSYNYMSKYNEEINGNAVVLNSPTEKYKYNYITTKKEGYFETPDDNDGIINIIFTNPKYISKNYCFLFNVGSEYSLTDKIGLKVQFHLQRGIMDIENKGIGKETSTHVKSGTTYSNTFNYWNETNYLRYYNRYPEKYNQRPSTYTQAIGLGIGINYYFKGGLLPSTH